ncbi:MAG: glycosyltransferase family 39 protein [Terriglobia bacterium]
MREQRDNFARYAIALLVLGALARFPVMILLRHIPILVYSDFSYLQAGQAILRFNFHALGDRVPVYPLLVALCGLHPHVIWFAQSVLGVTASLMIFDMAFRRTRHGLFSLLVGLACSLSPEVLVYESSLMTEALTNFLLVTLLWFISRYDGTEKDDIRYLLVLGSIIALAALTRPLMICLVPVCYCSLFPIWPPTHILQREALKRTLYFALPVAVFVLGWCGFNYFNSGYFSPTTRAGEHLMAQVDPYVDLAPERFAVPRDAWLQSRRQIRGTANKNASLVYGGALPELERQTGKTESQISHEYESLALYLQIHHPLLCLRRAEQSWMQFWGEPTLDELEWPEGSKVGLDELLMTMTNFLVREIEAAFLVLALFSVPCALLYPKAFAKLEYLAFAMALSVSLFAAFTEYGENRRYCVPFYMLIIYTLLTRAWLWITATSSAAV